MTKKSLFTSESNSNLINSLIIDIQSYLNVHINAKDSLSGVRIWLARQRYEVKEEFLQEALDYLIREGTIREDTISNGTKIYGKAQVEIPSIKTF